MYSKKEIAVLKPDIRVWKMLIFFGMQMSGNRKKNGGLTFKIKKLKEAYVVLTEMENFDLISKFTVNVILC